MAEPLELPRVRALEIAIVVSFPYGDRIYFSDIDYAPVDAEPGMFANYTPVAGDFYVVYDGGYKSISPRKTFLEGYDKI